LLPSWWVCPDHYLSGFDLSYLLVNFTESAWFGLLFLGGESEMIPDRIAKGIYSSWMGLAHEASWAINR